MKYSHFLTYLISFLVLSDLSLASRDNEKERLLEGGRYRASSSYGSNSLFGSPEVENTKRSEHDSEMPIRNIGSIQGEEEFEVALTERTLLQERSPEITGHDPQPPLLQELITGHDPLPPLLQERRPEITGHGPLPPFLQELITGDAYDETSTQCLSGLVYENPDVLLSQAASPSEAQDTPSSQKQKVEESALLVLYNTSVIIRNAMFPTEKELRKVIETALTAELRVNNKTRELLENKIVKIVPEFISILEKEQWAIRETQDPMEEGKESAVKRALMVKEGIRELSKENKEHIEEKFISALKKEPLVSREKRARVEIQKKAVCTLNRQMEEHNKFQSTVNKSPFSWTSLKEQTRDLDHGFFEIYLGKNSKTVLASWWIGMLLGLFPAQGNAPILYVNIADTFGISVGSFQTYIFGALTTLTTPVYMHQLGEASSNIVKFFENDPLEKMKFERSIVPTVLKIVAGLSTVIPAVVKGAYFVTLEGNGNEIYSYVMVGPLVLAEFCRRYYCASVEIDKLYRSYVSSENSQLERRVLGGGLRIFRNKIRQEPGFARMMYTLIRLEATRKRFLNENKDNQDSGEDTEALNRRYFKLSSLFFVPAERDLSYNFQSDVSRLGQGSYNASVVNTISDMFSGLAAYTTSRVTQTVLNDMILSKIFGASPAVTITSEVIGFFSGFARTFLEFDSRRTWLQNLRGILSPHPLGSYSKVRKGLGLFSFFSGITHSFTEVAIGAKTFGAESVISKIALLSSIGFADIPYYDSWFNQHFNEILTKLTLLKSEELNNEQIINILSYLSVKLEEKIANEFDDDLVSDLYKVIYNRNKSLEKPRNQPRNQPLE